MQFAFLAWYCLSVCEWTFICVCMRESERKFPKFKISWKVLGSGKDTYLNEIVPAFQESVLWHTCYFWEEREEGQSSKAGMNISCQISKSIQKKDCLPKAGQKNEIKWWGVTDISSWNSSCCHSGNQRSTLWGLRWQLYMSLLIHLYQFC